MQLHISELIILTLIFFAVATFYSSVGFGGGSSYLAFLALFLTDFFAIRSIALLCNLIVVGGSFFLYYRKGLFNFKMFLPFILSSIPMAFIGASFRLKENVFFTILGGTLIISAVALFLQTLKDHKSKIVPESKKYPSYLSYVLGGIIGLLAGLVGIGGGIFLAPVLNHMRWNKPVVIASLTSFFILVNSLSGLGGLFINDTFRIPVIPTFLLLLVVMAGGQLGTRISLSRLSGYGIRRITALLVFIVGIRVLVINGLQIEF